MTTAYSDNHPADANRHGIAAERALMKRFDGNAFVETEIAKPTGAGRIEQIPVNRVDSSTNANLQGFKGRFRHIAIDYQ